MWNRAKFPDADRELLLRAVASPRPDDQATVQALQRKLWNAAMERVEWMKAPVPEEQRRYHPAHNLYVRTILKWITLRKKWIAAHLWHLVSLRCHKEDLSGASCAHAAGEGCTVSSHDN
jgi:hypothetical protein